MACQTVAGNEVDDLLYRPAYDAAIRTLTTRAVLVVGDSKMAARAPRAHIVAGGSAYLCAYRPAISTAQIAALSPAGRKDRGGTGAWRPAMP